MTEPAPPPPPAPPPLRVLVMGVSGAGKSTLGAALAGRLACAFVDGDDLHPAANRARMAAGTPLTDADRRPWLDRVAGVLAGGAPVVVACSALKRRYRARICAGAGGPVRLVFLDGARALVAARLGARRGHFMPPALLDSQFAALEPPAEAEAALRLDVAEPVALLVARAEAWLLDQPPAMQ